MVGERGFLAVAAVARVMAGDMWAGKPLSQAICKRPKTQQKMCRCDAVNVA